MAAGEELDIPMPTMAPGYGSAPRRRHEMDPATRRLALFAGGIGAALLLLVGVWSLNGHRHGAVPVIEADSRPLREKPANPGGLQVEGANDAILSGEVEGHATVAPGPEAPAVQALQAQEQAARADVSTPAAEAIGQPATPTAPGTGKALPAVHHPAAVQPDATLAAAPPPPPATQMTTQMTDSANVGGLAVRLIPGARAPGPIASVPGSPRQAQMAQSSSPITSESLPAPGGTPAQPTQIAPQPTPTPTPTPPAPMTSDQMAPAPAAATPAPPAKPASAATTAPTPHAPAAASASTAMATPHAGGHLMVQLGALPSGEAALAEWARLQKKIPDLFDGRTPNVSKVERGGKTFWRLRTDSFASTTEAALFCQRVKAKGAACAVATF